MKGAVRKGGSGTRSIGSTPLVYRCRIDACWQRLSQGFVQWTCGLKANRFAFASEICRPEAALCMDKSNVHFVRKLSEARFTERMCPYPLHGNIRGGQRASR